MDSTIGRWIRTKLSGFNLGEVVCIDDEQTTDSFLQFRIPISEEDDYPRNCLIQGRSIAIDHALPFAPPVNTRARPPHEQTVHEHWKKSARLAPHDKKGQANCIAKTENCFRSLQRVIRLRESSHQTNTVRLSVYRTSQCSWHTDQVWH